MKPKNPDQVGGRWSKDPIPGVLGLVGGKSRILGTYKRILRLRDHETWRISEIRLAISWGASGSIGIPVVNCGGDPAKSRCRMHLKNIHKNPFKQVAFQDCEDSKVTTNLQKVRQEKKTKRMRMGKKMKNKASQTAPPERFLFFRTLVTNRSASGLIRMDLDGWVFGMRSLSKSKKNRWKRGWKPKANVKSRRPRWKVRCCATSSRRISRRIIYYIYTVWILPKHLFTVDKV